MYKRVRRIATADVINCLIYDCHALARCVARPIIAHDPATRRSAALRAPAMRGSGAAKAHRPSLRAWKNHQRPWQFHSSTARRQSRGRGAIQPSIGPQRYFPRSLACNAAVSPRKHGESCPRYATRLLRSRSAHTGRCSQSCARWCVAQTAEGVDLHARLQDDADDAN